MVAGALGARAQSPPGPSASANADTDASPPSFFEHPESRFWFSGQANYVLEWHPTFPAKYSGPHSLTPAAQSETSRVETFYAGLRLTRSIEVLADLESSGGGGIGSGLGLAGYTNFDVVRAVQGVPVPKDVPYLARLILHQVIALSGDTVPGDRGPLGLATTLPARRLEWRVGKFTLPDFFDVNSVGSDSHFQFLNWAVVNNDAWDYAGNTRGYTWAAMLEYDEHQWSVRFAEALMPKVANGLQLDADLARAHAENIEGEWRTSLLPHKSGAVRVLSYVNHGDMGNYREAIDAFLAGKGTAPDVIQTRKQGRVKYGFGLNLEQDLSRSLTVYGRWGWNEGHNESFVYTEANETLSFGGRLGGSLWGRANDRLGVAYATNGISADHQRYLALGGLGFQLGDGGLNYAQEKIVETFYTVHVWRGVFVSFDLQHIQDPGYNRDRGPVVVPGGRLHLEF
jgi:hypothetical protein